MFSFCQYCSRERPLDKSSIDFWANPCDNLSLKLNKTKTKNYTLSQHVEDQDLLGAPCTHGPEHRSVESTYCDILDNHCKVPYGEPGGEGCVCGMDIYGERFEWCTISKRILDDLDYSDSDDSDGSCEN